MQRRVLGCDYQTGITFLSEKKKKRWLTAPTLQKM